MGFKRKLFKSKLNAVKAVKNATKADIAEKRIGTLETHCVAIQKQLVEAQNRLYELQVLAGDASLEDRMAAATNYEFGLKVMRKQLEDQLLYIDDITALDPSMISTIKFESVEALCRTMIAFIDVLMQTSS